MRKISPFIVCTVMLISMATPAIGSGELIQIAQNAEPDIWVNPGGFDFAVELGQTDTDILTIGNNGTTDLNYLILGAGGANKVLLLDGAPSGSTEAINALVANGFNVTEAGVPSTYTGSPDPSNFNLVILFLGDDYNDDMPAAGQTSIENYVNNGGGIIMTEWIGYHVQNGRYSTIAPMLPMSRGGGNNGDETCTIVMSHPITDGVPSPFTTVPHSFGVMTANASTTVVVDGSMANDEVGFRSYGSGMAVHFATVGKDSFFNAWTDPNLLKLMLNSANWLTKNASFGLPEWLTVSPGSGSIAPSGAVNHSVMVNTTTLTPGYFTANITILNNDPDEDPTIVPVNLTVLSTFHDICIYNMTIAGNLEAGKKQWVNGTILNQGLNNETNIEVRLLVDFGLENSTVISSILSGSQDTVSFGWVPPLAAQYTLTLYAVPVAGETFTLNNWRNMTVNITGQPDIWVSPSGFDFVVQTGMTDSDNLSIGNDGLADLNYNIIEDYQTNIFFSDNFDSEVEGTSPPINWVPDTQTNYNPLACEVDDQQSKSGPHSLYLRSPSTWFGFCHHDIPGGFTDEPYYFSVYPTSTTIYGYLLTQNSVGNFDDSQTAAYIGFRNDGNIKYYAGSWINTGVSYVANSWNDMIIIHDFNNNTFDCWHNGVLIIDDGGFRSPSSDIKSLQFGISSVGNPDYMWIDDIQIANKTPIWPDWLSVTPLKGSIAPFGVVNHTVMVNTTTLTPGLYHANITILNNDPEEDPTIVPVNLTVVSAPHDICIHDMTIEGNLDTGKKQWVNGTILNLGLNEETNVEVRLLVDFGLENSTVISSILSGSQDTVSFGWVPPLAAQYTLTLYAVPVAGETFTLNNWLNMTVNITDQPDIRVSPSGFDFVVQTGMTDSDDLSVGNDGLADLYYDIIGDYQSNIFFSDNFDSEVEGTSPPINWVPDTQSNYIPLACEVDDQRSKSGPHSMYLLSPSVWFGFCHHDIPGGFTDEPYYFSVYPTSTTIFGYLLTQNSVGNFDDSQTAAYIGFRDDGFIKYYAGSWINTGVSYVANSWNDMIIIHDFNNNTFDCWHNGVLIIDDGGFRSPSSDIKSLQFGISSVGNPDYMWIDDIQIGNNTLWPDWLTVSPLTGSLLPFENANHTVTVNTTTLTLGFYQANFTIQSNDPNEDSVVIYVNLNVIDTAVEIPLQMGWNLISIPLEQSNESIDQVFSSINGKWDIIQTYDTLSPEPWKSHNTYKPDSLNDFDTINHKVGFWINITEPNVNLTVTGPIPTSTIINLYTGWNLVSYPAFSEKTIADALAGTGYDTVVGYDAMNPYRLTQLSDSYMMKPGEGYWVHVPADSVWVVDW